MSYAYPQQSSIRAGRQSAVQERAQFIMRTYAHLLGAILAFTGFQVFLFTSGLALPVARTVLGVSPLIVLGLFVVASMVATHVAHSARSLTSQYAGLALFVAVESIIFVPMLFVAEQTAPGAISSAAGVTLLGFGGLTAVAFITRKDFSFLRGLILWGGVLAMVTILGGAIFGFALGTFFSVAMVGLAGAAILYDTSNIILHYPANRYVGAALQLFASVAMMFWYVLRLFMSRD